MSLFIKVKKTDGSTIVAESTTMTPTAWQYYVDCDGDNDANSIAIQLTDDATPIYLKLSIPAAHKHDPFCDPDTAGCTAADTTSTMYWNKAVGEVISDALERDNKAAHISVMSDECCCVYGSGQTDPTGAKNCQQAYDDGDINCLSVKYYNHIFDDVEIGTLE